MPRLRINLRDLDDLDELLDLEETEEPNGRDREERREVSALAIERRQEERRRGKLFNRHLKGLEKLRSR